MFEKLLAKSNEIWDDFTTGKNKKQKQEPVKVVKKSFAVSQMNSNEQRN